MATITGTAGNDTLTGTDVADNITGLAGDDTLKGAGGNDTIDGGTDTNGDWVSYEGAPIGVTVNLTTGTATDGLGGTDVLLNIERVVGTAFNDSLTGNLRRNYFRPGAGDDTVNGVDTSYNSDAVQYWDSTSSVNIDLKLGVATGAYIGTDVLLSIEGASGSKFNDVIVLSDTGGWADGDDGNDLLVNGSRGAWLTGGRGDDTLVGGISAWDIADYNMNSTRLDSLVVEGNAAIGWTLRNAGTALIRVQVSTSSGQWTVTDLRSTSDLANPNFGNDLLTGIEQIQFQGLNASATSFYTYLGLGGTVAAPTLNFLAQMGTASSEVINGSSYADTLSGGAGNDTLNGLISDDTLRGGPGNDLLNGGEQRNLGWRYGQNYATSDYDTADYTDVTVGGIRLDLSTMTVTGVNGADVGIDTLRGIEDVRGTRQADLVIGSFAALSGNNEAAGDQHQVDIELYGGSDTVTLTKVQSMPWLDGPYIGYWWSQTAVTASFSGSVGTVSYGAGSSQVAGADTVDGVALFGDTSYNDRFDFSGMTSNFQVGGRWNYVYLNQGGNDTVVGNGDTTVNFANSTTLLSTTGKGIDVHLAAPGTTFTVDMTHLSRSSSWSYGTVTLSNIEAVRGTNLDDTLVGGAYDDYESFRGKGGNDFIDGGTGEDRAEYFGGTSGVTVNLAAGTVTGDSSIGTDTLRSIERIQGTAYDDVYDARGFSATSTNAGSWDQWNQFDGRGGNDTIYGNTKTMLHYGASAVAVEVNLATGKAWALNPADRTGDLNQYVGTDTFTGVFRVRGTALGDLLLGGGAGWMSGDTGVEMFDPDAGNDTVNGYGEWDYVRYGSATAAITVDLRLPTGQVQDGMGGVDTLIGIEGVQGSDFNDVMVGSDVNNTGYGNQESFVGRKGNDTINGGGGYDEVEYTDDPANGVVVNLMTGLAQDGWGGTDTLSNIEGVEGSWKADSITGNSSDNRLDGRGGNDTLDGGAGIDTAEYNQATGAVQVNLALGTATGADGNDTLLNIENLHGSIYSDTLAGNTNANRIFGGAGNDTINGAGGTDVAAYSGNRANYAVTVSNSGVTVTDNVGNEGTDTLTNIEQLAFADLDVNVSGSPIQVWTRLLGNTGEDLINELAIGTDGSLYAAGVATVSVDGQAASGLRDLLVAKYATDGTKLWSKVLGTTAEDFSFAQTIGVDGAMYVGGSTGGALNGQVNSGGYDAFGIRFNADGTIAWTKLLGTSAEDSIRAMATGLDGSMYAAGHTAGSLNGQANSGNADALLIKGNLDGTIAWTRVLGTAGYDIAADMTVGLDGSIYITGETTGSLSGLTNAGGADAFVAKYSSDGSLLWTRMLGTSGTDRGYSLTIGLDGSLYVNGATAGGLDGNIKSAGAFDAFLTKYSTDGVKMWSKLIGNSSNGDVSELTTGKDGSIYVTGQTSGTLAGLNASSIDGFISKYDDQGNRVWTQLIGTSGIDSAYSLATGQDGSIYVSGHTSGGLNGQTYGGGPYDAFITKYQPAEAQPVYAIAAATPSVNEGASASFNLTATNLPAGTVIGYSITGVAAADIVGGALSGTVSLNASGTAIINVPVSADNLAEGTETVKVSVQGLSAGIIVNDTSVPPVASPQLISSSPNDNANSVLLSANLTLTFNASIKTGTGNLVLTNTANPADTRTIPVTDSVQVSISGSSLTVDPAAYLLPGAHYALTLAAGAIKDLAGNDFAGITSSTALDFDTVASGSTASYTPGQALIDLGSYGKLIAPVQVDGGKWYYFWDRSGDGTIAASAGSLNGGRDDIANIVLDAIFNQDVNGLMGGGSHTNDTYRYATLNGVHVALPTVGGVTSPPYGALGINSYQPGSAVGSATPANGSNALNSTYDDLLAIWDAYNGAGTGVSIDGTPPGWQPYAYWSATSSTEGHPYVDMSGFVRDYPIGNATAYVALQVLESFPTADTTPPTVLTFSPADEATGVAVGANIVLTFNEAIQRGAGSIVIKTAAGTTVATYDASTSTNLSISGNSLTINPTADLASITGYSVVLASGTVKDLGGNSYAGTSDYNFTTVGSSSVLRLGTVAGVDLNLIHPYTSATGKTYYLLDINGDGNSTSADFVGHDTTDRLFNGGEDTYDTQPNGAVAGVDDARTLIVGGYTLVQPTNAEIIALRNALNYTFPTGWQPQDYDSPNIPSASRVSNNVHYNVSFKSTNIYTNLYDGYGYNGSIFLQVLGEAADTTAPTLTSSTPADNASAVLAGANLTLTFSEAIKAGTGNLVLTNTANAADTRTLSVSDASQVSISGSQLTLDPTAELLGGAHYALTLGSGVVQDLAGNAYAGISSATTLDFTVAASPVKPTLSGIAYDWKNHMLLQDVAIAVKGGGAPAEGANAPIQFKGLVWDASGHASVEVWTHATTAFESAGFDLEITNASGISFTAGTLPNTSTGGTGWTLITNAIGTNLTVGGFANDSTAAVAAGDFKLGTITFETATAQRADLHLFSGDVGSASATAYGLSVARTSSSATGTYSISTLEPGSYDITASRAVTDIGNAITSADALAALKMAVGLNPNPDPDGAGPLSALVVSPYQFMAADVTGTDGRVTSADALAILKMAVKLPTAPTKEWMFVEESRNFWNETTGQFTLSRNSAGWDHAISTNLQAGTTTGTVNLVGVLKGDVNGSWAAPAGSTDLDTIDPTHFIALSSIFGMPVGQFGVV